MTPSKAYLIDVAARKVIRVQYDGRRELRALVGGYIEIVCRWPNGDALVVDEDRLVKPQPGLFTLQGKAQSFVGNGVIIGEERADVSTAPPRMLLEDLVRRVRFVREHWKLVI
jgi:hypothetical protein